MAKKSSDSVSQTPPVDSLATVASKRDAPVFVVASDRSFLARARRECANLPADAKHVGNMTGLVSELASCEKLTLAFVLLVEPNGRHIDVPGLRSVRLEFPQVVIFAVLDECDHQTELRLRSIGVQSVLLPPFDGIDIEREIATAIPNVTPFKHHPDLMRRGQVRLDFLFPSDLSYVLGINHEIVMLLKEFGFPPQDVRINIPLACDEAITNAIMHGNRSDPERKVNVQIYVSHSRFKIRVRDQGDGFDADHVADPRTGENVHRARGRGIFLMRSIMDSVRYREGGRVLEMEKFNTNAKRSKDNGQ